MSYQNFLTASQKKPNSLLYLVRHAESEGNLLGAKCKASQETPLTEAGKENAQQLGEYFKSEINSATVFASPKSRTLETAEAIASALGEKVKTEENFIERHWGEYNDLNWLELSAQLDGMSDEERYTFVPEGGESWQAMEERFFKALAEIVEAQADGGNLVVVTHNGCLRAVLPILAKTGYQSHKDYSMKVGSVVKYSFKTETLEFII